MRSMCEVAYSQRVFRRPASGFSDLPGSDPNPTRALADTQATDATRTRNAHTRRHPTPTRLTYPSQPDGPGLVIPPRLPGLL